MTDFWNDPVGWRDAMIPPVTFDQALKAARKAKAVRFVWRGVVFDIGEPEAAGATLTPLAAWKAAKRARRA
jgi:hypothetical protein